jgi:Ca2+-binding RTX toxin-like protein
VTTTPAEDSDSARITGSGRYVVFRTSGDVGGTNPDNSSEVYIRNLDTGVTSAVTTTAAAVENEEPSISANGRRIAFASDGDLAGQNPDPSPELFLRETTAQTTEALTAVPDSANFGLGSTAMDAGGSRVAFESDEDYVGTNANGGFEVYLRDFGASGQRITQVTNGAASSGEVDIDRTGRHVVFSSRSNLTGTNADGGREIFLATCSAPPPPAQCDGQLVTVNRARGETPTTGNDVIRGTNGADTVNAKAGNDRFCGLNGVDTFNGANGNDRAFGGGGNDRLRGDAGNDVLAGEAGNDQLNGGPGPDTCKGGPGTDSATACTTRAGIP